MRTYRQGFEDNHSLAIDLNLSNSDRQIKSQKRLPQTLFTNMYVGLPGRCRVTEVRLRNSLNRILG